jgi:hypothetical protein
VTSAVDPTARDIAEKLAPAYRTMLDAIAQVEPRYLRRICQKATCPWSPVLARMRSSPKR